MADEQAALLRVSAVVARSAPRSAVFAAVAEEASTLVDGLPAVLVRIDGPHTHTVVATHCRPATPGTAISSADEDQALVAEVLRTLRGERRDDDVGTPPRPIRTDDGVRSAIGSPVVVDGRLWGVLAVCFTDRSIPVHVEERLQRFTSLTAGAIGNAQVRIELERSTAEQAGLRRVAQLPVGGATTEVVCAAVTREASALLGRRLITVLYLDDDGIGKVVAASEESITPGTRFAIKPCTVMDEVVRTGRSARVDDYGAEGVGPGGVVLGLRASVGVPIRVGGTLRGVLAASSPDGALPPDAESRLERFAEVLATAITTTEIRRDLGRAVEEQVGLRAVAEMAAAELRATADEQAALREVAELAARGEPAESVLRAVAVRVCRLPGVHTASVMRHEPDDTKEIVALENAPPGVHVGMRAPAPGSEGIGREQIRRAVRVDDLTIVPGDWARTAMEAGFVASVTVPIPVEGVEWGILTANGREGPLPRGVEDQLSAFADLVGIAVAGDRNRARSRALADEQAALRRVAELVARRAPQHEVFTAVAVEASGLLGGMATALELYVGTEAVVVADCRSPAPLGLRVALSAGTAVDEVMRTGRPARVDSYEGTPLAAIARELGVVAGVAVPITVEGGVRAALTCSSSGPAIPAGTEQRLAQFTELAAMAIANTETRAQLVASRARIVAAADEARRRLQRDVHDGAQQRLVHTIIALKFARQKGAAGGTVDDLISEALAHAERAAAELRNLVHGILPASLTRNGLAAGVESLVVDLPTPVDVRISVPRLPATTETTAYYVVAEALTNVVKHARAGRASVFIRVDHDHLSIEVSDDGCGGADPSRGSGLTGLLDRVDAAEGNLTISSPVGYGTVVRAALPLPPNATEL